MGEKQPQDKYADIDQMREEMRNRMTRSQILTNIGYGCVAIIGAAATAAGAIPAATISTFIMANIPIAIAGAVLGVGALMVGATCTFMGWRENAEINVLSEEINSSLNAEKIGKKIGEVLLEKEKNRSAVIDQSNVYSQNQRVDGKLWTDTIAQITTPNNVMAK